MDHDYTLTPLERVFCASIGATLTVVAMTPLDVVKTRVQAAAAAAATLIVSSGGVNGLSPSLSRSALSTTMHLVRSEGIKALWRGVVPSLLMAVPSQALYFVVYDSLRASLERRGGIASAAAPFAAGMASRALVVVALAPLELIRTQAMASRHTTRVPLLAALRAEANSGGGLWRGLVPTLVRDVPFSGIYWLAYEAIRQRLGDFFCTTHQHSHPARQSMWVSWATSFTAGLAAGSLAAALTTPCDVVKTRFQLSRAAPSQSFGSELVRVARLEGFPGLFSGVGLRVARAGPACGLMISSYETGKRMFATKKYE